MELTDALRSTGAVRAFLDEPVLDEVLYAILDDARFAPSGGNRQAWRVIIVNDERRRRALRDLYLDGWHDYIAHVLAGLIPFSPLATDEDRATAASKRSAAIAVSKPDGFPETIDQVPVMLVICADLAALAARSAQMTSMTGTWSSVSGKPSGFDVAIAAARFAVAAARSSSLARGENGISPANTWAMSSS